jgi:hypothetical protein
MTPKQIELTTDGILKNIHKNDFNPNSVEAAYKIRYVVGNGFTLLRNKHRPRKIGKLNKAINSADFICQACNSIKGMPISVILNKKRGLLRWKQIIEWKQ